MENTITSAAASREATCRRMQGMDYEEMLELQAETGLTIRQIEFMYYNFSTNL